MKNQISFLGAVCALAAISATDIAQSANSPPEQVTRFGPYAVTRKFETTPYNAPRTVTSVSRGISYQGLDLTSDADVAKLEARIRQVAADVCQELDRRRPRTIDVSRDEVKNCVQNTSESALTEFRTKVAAVRGNGQSAQAR